MSRLSITGREAAAEDRLVTDRQLPDHPPVARTDNVRYLTMAVDVRTSKLYTRILGDDASIHLATEHKAQGDIVSLRSLSVWCELRNVSRGEGSGMDFCL